MSITATNLSQNALLSSKIAQRSQENNAQQSAAAKSNVNSTRSTQNEPTLYQKNKAQLNAQILEASAQVSLSANNQAQALFFKSASANISGQFNFGNQQIGFNISYSQTQFGFQASDLQNVDTSAEATSGRILNFATGFFDRYKAQHMGEDSTQVAQNFVNTVRAGFEKGFNEAKDILQSLQVFQGQTRTDIEKTYSLVQQGFDQFLNQQVNASNKTDSSPKV